MNQNMNQNWKQDPYVVANDYNRVQQDVVSQIASRSFLVVFLGLIVTTITAFLTANNVALMERIFSSRPTFIIICVMELVVVLGCSFAINKNVLGLALGLYVAYTILNGITLSIIFVVYDIGQVQEAFLLTTILFGAISAYGYFTKRDLSTLGSICTMALFGAIIVTLANLFFFHSAGIDLLMDYVVVAIFIGLTAFDMYRMKQQAATYGASETNRIALFTGMQLYLDFINLFLRLVRIMGRRD